MAEHPLPLAPYRVLDCTDQRGLLCGRLLADLGADVLQVEPPQGNPARRLGPFYGDDPHPEKSLFWWAYAANKRSITLDLSTADGQALFRRLLQKAHFVLESADPGEAQGLGLTWEQVRAVNPSAILVSISPFGREGAYAHWEGSDLLAWAVGGLLYLTGDPDRPPLRVSFPQALLLASLSAVVGALIAHWHRLRTGQGQWVDASAQEAVARLLSNATPMYDLNREVVKREGAIRWGAGGRRSRMVWPCKDGYVAFLAGMGPAQGRSSRALLAWMREEGMPASDLEALPWESMLAQDLAPEVLLHIQEVFGAFFRTKSKGELWEGALRRRILLFPVSTPQDLEHFPQLEARRFWTQIEHEDWGISLPYPGPAVVSTYAPMGLRRRAPHLGEHNREVFVGDLGLTPEQMAALRQAGVV